MDFFAKVLLLISLVHAYVFAILFFASNRKTLKVMGFYMLNVAFQYLLFINIQTFDIGWLNQTFYFVIIPLSLSSHPLIYLYVKDLTDEYFQYTFKVLYHFLPAVVLTITFFILLPSLSPDEKITLYSGKSIGELEANNVIVLFGISTLVMFAQMLFYGTKMLIQLFRHTYNVELVHSSTNEVSLFWLRGFVMLYVLYYLFEFALFVFKGINISETIYFSLIALHVFFLGFMAFKQKDIYQKVGSQNDVENEVEKEIDLTPSISDEKDLGDVEKFEPKFDINVKHLSRQDELLIHSLIQRMNEEKFYLKPDISLYDLAKEMKVSKNQLSSLINDHLNMNFFTFINLFRIEEAKSILLNSDKHITSIETVAQSVGFKSRSVFNPVFKRIVGKTPSQFRKNPN